MLAESVFRLVSYRHITARWEHQHTKPLGAAMCASVRDPKWIVINIHNLLVPVAAQVWFPDSEEGTGQWWKAQIIVDNREQQGVGVLADPWAAGGLWERFEVQWDPPSAVRLLNPGSSHRCGACRAFFCSNAPVGGGAEAHCAAPAGTCRASLRRPSRTLETVRQALVPTTPFAGRARRRRAAAV